MTVRLNLQYPTAGDFVKHMQEQDTAGAVLIPMTDEETSLQQFEPVEMRVCFESGEPGGSLDASVLQVISAGVAVKLDDPADAVVLSGGVAAAEPATPPEVSMAEPESEPEPEPDPEPAPDQKLPDDEEAAEPAEDEDPKKWVSRRKSGPLSWSFDMLQSEWNGLTPAEKARVAKWGDRSARGLVLKKQDRTLHAVLLTNPKLTPNEVAVLVARPNLGPELLRRIAVGREWTRHLSVSRALVCNPKLPIPQVNKLLRSMDLGELRRLSRSGKVRASVKGEIKKQIARLTGKRR